MKLKQLPNYSKQDLRELGLAYGPAKAIHDALAKYRNAPPPSHFLHLSTPLPTPSPPFEQKVIEIVSVVCGVWCVVCGGVVCGVWCGFRMINDRN